MKNNLLGFSFSALVHLAIAGPLLLMSDEQPATAKTDVAVPLTLAMFEAVEPAQPQDATQKPPLESTVAEKIEAEPQSVLQPEPEPVSEPEPPKTAPKLQPAKTPTLSSPRPVTTLPVKEKTPEIQPEKKKPVITRIEKKQPKPKPEVKKPKPKQEPISKKVVTQKPPLQAKPSKKPAKKPTQKPVVKDTSLDKLAQQVLRQSDQVVTHQVKRPVTPAPVRSARPATTVQRDTRPVAPAKKAASRQPVATVAQSARPARPAKQVVSPNQGRLEQAYKARLRQLIEAKKKYPMRARRLGKQGMVKLSFVIAANGAISQIRVIQSSGSRILDEAAVKAVRQISGRLPFPREIRRSQWRFTLPLTYRIRS